MNRSSAVRKLIDLLFAGLSCLVLASQTLDFPPQTNCVYDLAPVTQTFSQTLAQAGIFSGSLLILKDGEKLLEQYKGIYRPETVVPIASATKWVSAVVIMSLVDDGVMTLDDPVSKYLPNYYSGLKGTMTIRQMFSHTSGLPGGLDHPVLNDDSITLQQAAQIISTNQLIAAPGAVFCYGGLSMQVAGACAEIASGTSWSNLFNARVKQPLGLTAMTYGNTANPRIAGGLSSSLHEYAAVLQMLLNHGLWGTNRVLSADAVREMQKDQTGGAEILCSPFTQFGLGDLRYGIGEWRDLVAADGTPTQLSSIGVFGFSPWIDTQRNLAGVFMVLNNYTNVVPGVLNLQSTLRDIIDATPCSFPPILTIQPSGAHTNLLTVNGARGRSYNLELSADLARWTSMETLPGTNGTWQIPLPASQDRQFFRAVLLR